MDQKVSIIKSLRMLFFPKFKIVETKGKICIASRIKIIAFLGYFAKLKSTRFNWTSKKTAC